LIELVVSVSLLAIMAGGLMASLGLGFRTVALARQRQTAASIAEARLEHLRSIPYAQVALPAALVKSTDPDDPDSGVTTDGKFDIDGKGTTEPLIVDPAGGVLHFEDPVQVGTTAMKVYQYVTWVDEPGISGPQDYRRVTVIVVFKTPTVDGIAKFVRASGIFSEGTVQVSSPNTTAAPPTTTPPTTVPPTTTTLGQSACPGDHDAPTGTATINGTSGAEAGYTAALNVTLNLALVDSCTPMQARVGNGGGTWSAWTNYDPASPQFSWTVTAGDGTKTVNVEAADHVANSAAIATMSIILDTTKPTVPDTLSRTVSCSGSDRTVNLSWGLSTDTNFRGYRIYRSTDGTTWSVLTQVAGTTAIDSNKKALDSVRYYAVAYDKAGNESNATTTIALSKNQCS
jgi:hypothetical protein